MLNPGPKATEFESMLRAELLFRDWDILGQQYLMLFFYPKGFTYACTKEACTFRDQFDEVKPPGAMIIGVRRDTLERHRAFGRMNRTSS